jgi:hypothetical protein
MYRSRKLRSLLSKKKRTNRRKSGARRTRRNKKVSGGMNIKAITIGTLALFLSSAHALSKGTASAVIGSIVTGNQNNNIHNAVEANQQKNELLLEAYTKSGGMKIVNDKLVIHGSDFRDFFGREYTGFFSLTSEYDKAAKEMNIDYVDNNKIYQIDLETFKDVAKKYPKIAEKIKNLEKKKIEGNEDRLVSNLEKAIGNDNALARMFE